MPRQFVLVFLVASLSAHSAFALNDPTKILAADALKDGVGGKAFVDPCENFYEFSCGSWIDRTPVPPSVGYVYRQNQKHDAIVDRFFADLLASQMKGKIQYPTRNTKSVTRLYQSCLNLFKNKTSSTAAIQQKLKKIESSLKADAFELLLSDLHREGVNAFFSPQSIMSTSGEKVYILNLVQGGFNFADRSAYEDTKLLKKYASHIKKVFSLLGYSAGEGVKKAQNIIRVETALAQAALPLENAYDPDKTTHLTDAKRLTMDYKSIDFVKYVSSIGVNTSLTVNLTEPNFMSRVDTIVADRDQSSLRDYLQWQTVLSTIGSSDGEMLREKIAFWDKVVDGLKEAKAPTKYCLDFVYENMGDALGEVFVKTLDSNRIISATERMIDQIKEAFLDKLDAASRGTSAWISSSVADRAMRKVKKVSQVLGASKTWKDYSSLNLSTEDLLSNFVQTKRMNFQIALSLIGKPQGPEQIEMLPWAMDAYYAREKNHFVLPFGILMSPSFDLSASEGANLGSLGGGTIGHELMHGFDDDGRKYDENGNIQDWWDDRSVKNYADRTACIAAQASKYPFVVGRETLYIKGTQTVTEDAADQSGMEIGRVALAKSLEKRAPAPLWLGKYTEPQQYWISYAQAWCANLSPETIKNMLATDEHSPAEYRVNGVMMNSKSFSQDFGCKVGARMNPTTKCSLW